MNSPTVTYSPLPDAAPGGELNALAAVYRFVLDCHAKKKAARGTHPDGRDSAKEFDHACAAGPIIQE